MPPDCSALARAMLAAGIPCRTSVPLRDCTTFRIGGAAALLASPQTEEQLIRALTIWRSADACPLFLLGRGSNVLFPDTGFPGLVICTRALQNTSVIPLPDGTVRLSAGCGALLATVSRRCMESHPALSGLEFACGIPGTLGGAVIMNAGAHGNDMADVVTESRYVDRETGCIGILHGAEHGFAYRRSLYQMHPEWILLSAAMTLPRSDEHTVRHAVQQHLDVRRHTQPLEYPNAGSIFRRPAQPGVYVGRLVEECGLKGLRIGGAEVSEKHAGFIVNRGDATAADVKRLIEHVRKTVSRTYGIDLACEICIVREDGSVEQESENHGQ